MWIVKIKKRVLKNLAKLPEAVQDNFAAVRNDVAFDGPEQPGWKNYSKLGGNRYHCHLNYHYVACWTKDEKDNLILEVYYVGSRENAPY